MSTKGLQLPKRVKRHGQITTSTTVKGGKGKAKLAEEKVIRQSATTLTNESINGDSLSTTGLSLGLTIPGPKNSYFMARADVWVSLPCDGTDEGIRAAQKRCSDLVQEHLEAEAQAINEFFNSM